MLKLKYCYHKCIKKFFGYNKFRLIYNLKRQHVGC